MRELLARLRGCRSVTRGSPLTLPTTSVTMYYDDDMRVEDSLELYPFFPSSRSRGHRGGHS
jgi:hypothetical protein